MWVHNLHSPDPKPHLRKFISFLDRPATQHLNSGLKEEPHVGLKKKKKKVGVEITSCGPHKQSLRPCHPWTIAVFLYWRTTGFLSSSLPEPRAAEATPTALGRVESTEVTAAHSKGGGEKPERERWSVQMLTCGEKEKEGQREFRNSANSHFSSLHPILASQNQHPPALTLFSRRSS